MRRLAPIALALACAACDGAGEGSPPVTTTVTETRTATVPLRQDRAYLLAFDFCADAPLDTISLIQGGSPEELARDFSRQIRPSLREAALQGCLAALRRR